MRWSTFNGVDVPEQETYANVVLSELLSTRVQGRMKPQESCTQSCPIAQKTRDNDIADSVVFVPEVINSALDPLG